MGRLRLDAPHVILHRTDSYTHTNAKRGWNAMSEHALKADGGRAGALLCRALLIASPFILLGVISLLIGKNAFAAYPVWGDELDIWRSLFSWQSVGLNKGFSGMYEAVPTLGTLGVTGLTPIILYGGFVKLFGLSEFTVLICNALWVSLSALVFCALVKPGKAVSLTFAALIVLYAPIAMYCVTSMTELFNYALILFYLAFLTRYYRRRGVGMLILCFLALALGCVYRGTYALLLIPTVLVYGDLRFSLKTVICAVISLAVVALCYYAASLYTAPSVQKFTYHFLRAESVGDMLRMLMSHGKTNLLDYMRGTGSAIQDGFRLMYCGVSLLCLLGSFAEASLKGGKPRVRFRLNKELLCCFALLFISLAFVIAFFETGDWVDFRLLAPFLWFVLGFLTLRRRRFIPLVSVAAGLVTLVLLFALPGEGAYSDEYRFTPQPDDERITAAMSHIEYDADASDPFVNTVRSDLCTLQVQKELHPGLGLQYGWFSTETTGRSKWILTDHLKCVVEDYELVYKEPGVNVYKLTDGGVR